MTSISSDHKYKAAEDNTLGRLLDLHGTIMEQGGGYWVKIEAKRVPAKPPRPFGVDYSLCLFGPKDERLVCFDNAHAVAIGSGPAKKRTARYDHVHKGERVKPYDYTSAETLLVDFWNEVDRILKAEGV